MLSSSLGAPDSPVPRYTNASRAWSRGIGRRDVAHERGGINRQRCTTFTPSRRRVHMRQLPTVKRILLVAAAAIGTTIAIAACSDADTLGPTPPASGSLSSTTGAG